MAENMPTGPVARVERQSSYRNIIQAAQPETVMLNFYHAELLAQDGETSDSFCGPADLITTTTINQGHVDVGYLSDLDWEKELDIISQLKPEYHIPTNYPVYADMALDARVQQIVDTMRGTAWIQEQLQDRGVGTTIIPFLKGSTQEERNICYTTYERLGIDYAMYDGRFAFHNGNRFYEMKEEIEQIKDEQPDLKLLLNGLLSSNYLEKLPDNVVAAAGQNQWLSNIDSQRDLPRDINIQFSAVMNDIRDSIPGQLAAE